MEKMNPAYASNFIGQGYWYVYTVYNTLENDAVDVAYPFGLGNGIFYQYPSW